jgi:hypothetical protein
MLRALFKSHVLLSAFLVLLLAQATSWAVMMTATYSCGQNNPNATQCSLTTRSWSITCGDVIPPGGGAITKKCLPETDPRKPKKTDIAISGEDLEAQLVTRIGVSAH